MLIIGISGGTGCGKTTVVKQIVSGLPHEKVGVLSQDAYYNDLSHLPLEKRRETNFDHPDSIDFKLLTQHLAILKSGGCIQRPSYSFLECNRASETVTLTPTNVLILEGILIFSDPAIRAMLDLKIYVHADPDERLIRRLKRDVTERGWNLEETLHNYQKVLKPMHDQFIEPMKQFADMIIPNNTYNPSAVDMVRSIVNEKIRQAI